MIAEQTRYTTLDAMGVIEVDGKDAESFLHGQLGSDVHAIGPDLAPLAAWHDARGRVRALVRIVRLPTGFALLLPDSHASRVAAELRMFVLRADVSLSHRRETFAAALIGTLPASLADRFDSSGARANAAVRGDGVVCIALGPRLHHLVADSAAALDAALGAPERVPPAAAELAEIELGLPSVGPEIAGRYLPQMLNLDLLHAMSFDKGCYPGQEIIARTQNLGTVKRRLARFRVPGRDPVAIDEEILDGAGASVGGTVRSAADGQRNELLAVVRTDVLDDTLGTVDGRTLQRLGLPYVESV